MSRRTQRSVVVARPHNGHSRTYDPDGATPIVLEYLRSRNIQHSGIGADILQLTDDLSSMLGREAIIVTQQEKLQGAIVKRAGVLTRSMKTERSARGRKGVRCERRECIAIEGKSKDISSTAAKGLKMKHCSGCQQVCYCSSECQRLDWSVQRV
ncbi:hypothetical protein BDW22DRAFT_287367 [Trametopsis cervina]|nr:hypothetical protein BDW22DRAFT_287367 [Trametopsis cervina]